MSLHYIIDGYNVMKQVARLTGKRLARGREGFIRFLETERPQGSSRNKVTVVFDGRTDVYAPRINSEIEVIFSHNESADEKIKKLVEKYEQKNLVVVSDDNAVKYSTKIQGASTMEAKEFLCRKSGREKSCAAQEEKINPQTSLGIEITKELEKIWVRNKNTQMGTG
jgi:predicted RNA-binding protein with PIN domain